MVQRKGQRWRVMLAAAGRQAIVSTTLAAFSLSTFAYATPAAFPANKNAASNAHSSSLPDFAPELEIPRAPSAPPSLIQTAPADPFHCNRKFVYQGKTLDCDSNIRRDAENLRPIIKDVPEAVAELDTYQRNRRNLRFTSYAASAGLLIVIAGYFITHATGGFRNADGSLPIISYVMIGGGAVGVGSFIYGFALYQTNESHLPAAVNQFNRVNPDNPIGLEFKTGIHF